MASSKGNQESMLSPPEAILLSEELTGNQFFITKERLDFFNQMAATIIKSSEADRTVGDKTFLTDFVLNIGRAKISETLLDATPRKNRRPLPVLPDTISANTDGFLLGPAQTIKINELALKCANFEGKSVEARAWIDSFERMAKANDWTEATMLKYLPSFLSKSASDWFVTLCQPILNSTTTWKEVRNQFIRHYLGEQDSLLHRRRLNKLFQATGESISTFMPKALLLMEMAYPQGKLLEEDKIELILEKLLPEYQEKLSLVNPSSLMNLNDLCLKLEQGQRASKAASRRLAETKPHEVKPGVRNSSDSSNKFVKRNNHNNNNIKRNEKTQQNNSAQQCSRCERLGHVAAKCFSSAKVDGTKLDPASAAPKPPRKTKNIATVESIPQQSNQTKIEPNSSSSNSQQVVEVRRVLNCIESSQNNLIHFPIKIEGIEKIAMMDSGAHVSVIREDLVKDRNWKISPSNIAISGADSHRINNLGKVYLDVELQVGDVIKRSKVEFIVVENLVSEIIFGIDLLTLFKIDLSLAARKITFADISDDSSQSTLSAESTCSTLQPKANQYNDTVARVQRETIIEARSIACVSAEVAMEGAVLLNPHCFSPTLLISNCVDEVKSSKISVAVANIDVYAVRLEPNTILGSIETLEEQPDKNTSAIAAIRPLANTSEVVNVGDNLSNNQLIELDALIQKFTNAFSTNGRIGSTTILSHKIELTPEARPFKEPHRRRPHVHVEEAKRQIQKMLESGVIEESNSPFASAYLLVKKKGGEMRLCVDFRKLNAFTKKCSYPLPNIEECLETLAGKNYFSTLDLASGFWQVPIDEDSRELTAFKTEEGLYQFRKMPFGLCNAPATFQKMVNILFSNLKGINMQVFIDDICVATNTWQEHLQILARVFQLLIDANLTLKPNKCTFGANEVVYLGHVLSAKGIKQNPETLKAILNIPTPKNVTELQSILGLLGYYRRFVPNFSQLSSSLRLLIKKNATFEWTADHENDLKTIMSILGQNATLKHFRYGHPTILKTDASRKGIGGILQQRDVDGDNCWKLVVCCSRRLDDAEKNYGITELECLAIIHCVTKLRPYLLGHPFTILTDHCALCALNLKEPKGERLKRWAIILSSFNFCIKYIKGGLHRDVDCLSRAPIGEAPDKYIEDYPMTINAIQSVSAIALPIDQERWLDEIDQEQEALDFNQKAIDGIDGFGIRSGFIYKNEKLYVPTRLRDEILQEVHVSSTAHGGVAATLNRLASRYWWPAMETKVRDFVKNCHVCQCRKAERQLPAGNMNHHQVIEPFQMVAFDCLGPLAETTDRKKHVILAIDMFTRFVDAKAVKGIDSTTFCKFFLSFVGRFGVPKGILTDNAPTFINSQVSTLTKLLNINHFKATPHHSRGNSVAERAIETLEEKLSLISSDDALNEWSRALPTAVLAMNSTEHKSVGYAPFTLMFGRRPPMQSKIANSSTSLFDLQASLVSQTLEMAHAEAVARQSDAQAASRPYFEARHQPRSFEIGDLVVARRMGRKAKLTSRFIGPYKVKSKENDIYSIESLDHKSHLQRHVKDLKPYSQSDIQPSSMQNSLVLGSILVLSCIIPSMSAFYVEEVSPIVWKPTHYYVSTGYTSFKLFYAITSPCDAIRQFGATADPPSPTALHTAVETCEQAFEVLTNKLRIKLAKQNQQTANYNVQLPGKSMQGLPQPPFGQQNQFPHGLQPNPNVPNQFPANQLRAGVQEKRSVTDTIAGLYISDVWSTVRDAIWTNPQIAELKDHLLKVETRLSEIRDQQNLTSLTLDALSKAVEINADLVDNNRADIKNIMSSHPALTVVTADAMIRLHRKCDLIDRIRISFRQKIPDLVSLAQLLETEDLSDVDPESIIHKETRITFPNPQVLGLEFIARKRIQTAEVLRVETFIVETNLTTEKPTVYTYVGPAYIVRNRETNCFQGISVPTERFVEAICEEKDYTDDALSHWVESSVDLDRKMRSQKIDNDPFVHVRCWRHRINITNVEHECPPYPFRLPASVSFSTSDGVKHSPSVMELSVNITEIPYIKVAITEDSNVKAKVHFGQEIKLFDSAEAINTVQRLRAEAKALRKSSTVLQLSDDSHITFRHLFYVLGCVITLLAGVACHFYFQRSKRCEIKRETRHRELHSILKAIIDTVAGAGTYESIGQAEKEEIVRKQSLFRDLMDARFGKKDHGQGTATPNSILSTV